MGPRSREAAYHVAGVNSHCPADPDMLLKVNVGGAAAAVRAAARAGIGRMVYTSSAASLGEPAGTVGTEDCPHRGSYLSVYDRSKHEGERAVFAAAAETGVEVVAVNPSSVQGPPRTGGNGAIIIAYLNGKLPAFVDTYVSVVDIQDCVEGHLLAAERGESGQRKTPSICRARVRTILHGHRYDGSRASRELGLDYTPVADTFARTIEWAVAEGLVTRPLPGTQRAGV